MRTKRFWNRRHQVRTLSQHSGKRNNKKKQSLGAIKPKLSKLCEYINVSVPLNNIVGVMVSLFDSSVVDRGFKLVLIASSLSTHHYNPDKYVHFMQNSIYFLIHKGRIQGGRTRRAPPLKLEKINFLA